MGGAATARPLMLAVYGADRRQVDDLAADCFGRVHRMGCRGVRMSAVQRNLAGGWVVLVTGWLPPGRVTSGEGRMITLPSFGRSS